MLTVEESLLIDTEVTLAISTGKCCCDPFLISDHRDARINQEFQCLITLQNHRSCLGVYVCAATPCLDKGIVAAFVVPTRIL